ncbi:MAG: hypothetical protein ACK526_19195 [Planctomyces sp.]
MAVAAQQHRPTEMLPLRDLRGPLWDLFLTTKITKGTKYVCDLLTDLQKGGGFCCTFC